MNTSPFPSDIAKDSFRNMGGWYGFDWVADTAAHTTGYMGYKAKTDTVIASITNATHDIGTILGSAALTLKAGDEIFFGAVSGSVTLTSGTGWFYLAQPRVLPATPNLLASATNAAGTEVIMNLDQIMNNPAALTHSFTLKVNGEVAAHTGVALDTDTTDIVVSPTTPIVNGDVVTITIATKIIKSAAGAYFLGATDFPIVNIVPA